MLFAKARNYRAGLVFLFSVLSFNFSNCFNYQELDTVRQIEVGLAAGKLPVAILADIFTVQDKKNAALALKTIALAMDVSNTVLKTYRHSGDISCFEYGYGAYDLFEIWNDIKDLRSLKESQSKKSDAQIFDTEENTKGRLKQLACYILKYSFLAADSATSIAFTLDEKEYNSSRNMYSWLNCWSKVIASSIDTKKVKISSKIPVYIAGALVAAVFSSKNTSDAEQKKLNKILLNPISLEIENWNNFFIEKISKRKQQQASLDSLESELKKKIAAFKSEIGDFTENQEATETLQAYEKDLRDLEDAKETAKADREYFEGKKKHWTKWFGKINEKMNDVPNREYIINEFVKKGEFAGLFNLLLRDPKTGEINQDFINKIDPELRPLFVVQ